MFSSFKKNTFLIFSTTFTNQKVVKKKEEFLLIFLKNTLLIFSKLIIVRKKQKKFEVVLRTFVLKSPFRRKKLSCLSFTRKKYLPKTLASSKFCILIKIIGYQPVCTS